MLDWSPETIESIASRFPKAFNYVWDADELKKLSEAGIDCSCPSSDPDHVFDFFSGIRISASKESMSNYGKYIHIALAFTGRGSSQINCMKQFMVLARATLATLFIDIDDGESAYNNGVLHVILTGTSAEKLCNTHNTTF